MIAGLSALDVGRLRMSVGYGTHKKGRPLSPVEVGSLLRRATEAGATLAECAKTLNLEGTSQLVRFIGILDLPHDIRHLVDWGRSSDSIGFTTAVELARVPDIDDQRKIASAILEQGLQTDEVRQVAQIRRRSQRDIDDCLNEILGMRPTVEHRYVMIGTVSDPEIRAALSVLTQKERDAYLHSALESLHIDGVSGHLGDQLFTLVGDDQLNIKLNSEGREAIEAQIRAAIRKRVVNV